MRKKKLVAMGLVTAMALSLAACGSSSSSSTASTTGSTESTTAASTTTDSSATDSSATASNASASSATDTSSTGSIQYKDITLGKTGTDVTAEIKLLTNRTDMTKSDYAGENWDAYIKKFNETYPNIKVDVEGITDYANDTLLRLQGGDWGDIMMIPAVDKADLSTYFLSYGSQADVSKEVNYINNFIYDKQVYGIPITANALGIVYNKAVFKKAGIDTLPKTTDEFIKDLKAIKDKTDATPLYTNYFANWTLGAWDAYIGGSATGDSKYMNQELLHTKDPFSDPGDGTHAYNVYKVLYDAVSQGLTEDDYTTTDWESSKGMMNSGKVATMVLGSWAVPQMQQAGSNPDDVAYMPFPITINGKQYASASPDYNFGINKDDSAEKQEASMIFVKWMTEESNFSYNEGGLPLKVGDSKYPDLYKGFIDNKVEFVEDDAAVSGEEDLMNRLNQDSELNINNGGNDKVAAIVEHAANKDEDFDSIMKEWNQKWSDAQKTEKVETK